MQAKSAFMDVFNLSWILVSHIHDGKQCVLPFAIHTMCPSNSQDHLFQALTGFVVNCISYEFQKFAIRVQNRTLLHEILEILDHVICRERNDCLPFCFHEIIHDPELCLAHPDLRIIDSHKILKSGKTQMIRNRR